MSFNRCWQIAVRTGFVLLPHGSAPSMMDHDSYWCCHGTVCRQCWISVAGLHASFSFNLGYKLQQIAVSTPTLIIVFIGWNFRPNRV